MDVRCSRLVHDVPEPMELHFLPRRHAQATRDSARPQVLRADQRDHFGVAPAAEGGVSRSGSGFSGVATTPELTGEQPADFRPSLALNLLHDQADLADGDSGVTLADKPEPVAITPVSFQLTPEPVLSGCLVKDALVIEGDLW